MVQSGRTSELTGCIKLSRCRMRIKLIPLRLNGLLGGGHSHQVLLEYWAALGIKFFQASLVQSQQKSSFPQSICIFGRRRMIFPII
jgi:hypothetical protein